MIIIALKKFVVLHEYPDSHCFMRVRILVEQSVGVFFENDFQVHDIARLNFLRYILLLRNLHDSSTIFTHRFYYN